MPFKILPICKRIGCKLRSIKGSSYCLEHQREVYKKHQESGEADPFYQSMKWRRVRSIIKNEEPLCRRCLKFGRVTPTSIIDHIVPRSEGGADFARSNLQGLCTTCHNQKRAAERHKKEFE